MVEARRLEQTPRILAQEKFRKYNVTYYKMDAQINGVTRTIFSYYPMSAQRCAERAAEIDKARSLLTDNATKEFVRERTDAFSSQLTSSDNYFSKPILHNDKYGELTPLIRQTAYERLYAEWKKYRQYSSAVVEES